MLDLGARSGTALHIAGEWEKRPKPAATRAEPAGLQDKKLFFEKFDLMLAMAQLALKSDSTRILPLMVDAFATPVFKLHPGQDTTDGYHSLSHHRVVGVSTACPATAAR